MKNIPSSEERLEAIKTGVSLAFGYDPLMELNIWANPEIRSQILKSIREGVKEAFMDFLEDGD